MGPSDNLILFGTLVILLLGGAGLYLLHAQQAIDDMELEELRLRILLAQAREQERE